MMHADAACAPEFDAALEATRITASHETRHVASLERAGTWVSSLLDVVRVAPCPPALTKVPVSDPAPSSFRVTPFGLTQPGGCGVKIFGFKCDAAFGAI